MLITVLVQLFLHVIIVAAAVVVVNITLPFLSDHKYPNKAMHSLLALTLFDMRKSYLDHDNMSDFVQLNIYNQIYYNVTLYVRLVRKWPHDLFDSKESKWDCTLLSSMCIMCVYGWLSFWVLAVAAVSMSVFYDLDKWFGGRGSSSSSTQYIIIRAWINETTKKLTRTQHIIWILPPPEAIVMSSINHKINVFIPQFQSFQLTRSCVCSLSSIRPSLIQLHSFQL